jgi:hypothetical protein
VRGVQEHLTCFSMDDAKPVLGSAGQKPANKNRLLMIQPISSGEESCHQTRAG